MIMKLRYPAVPLALWGLLGLCVLPELVLQGADLGLWGSLQWRSLAYGWFGFWPGLLHDWRPNYPEQPWAMFLTYGFLHGGLVHLVVNMITLVSMGRAVIDRAGQGRFLLIYAVSLLGGALGFGLLTNTTIPMVGASGALFGLVGAVIAWAVLDRWHESMTLWPVARAVLWLIALNVILWWATGGQLAWQTHLGGFVAGAAMGFVVDG
ncbi:MAG: rhomboid family intramembrane serine protease [bacterium]